MKLGQFHYYPSSVRKRRRKLLSDELLLVLAVGLTVGALPASLAHNESQLRWFNDFETLKETHGGQRIG